MRIYGVEITEAQQKAGLRAMAGRFKALDVAGALNRAGVPWLIPVASIVHRDRMPAYEAANRLLQRERKAGRIRAINNKNWERVDA